MTDRFFYQDIEYRLKKRKAKIGELILVDDVVQKATDTGEYLVLINVNAPLEKDMPDKTPILLEHENPLTRKTKPLVKIQNEYYRLTTRKKAQLGDFVIVVSNLSGHFFEINEVAEMKLIWSPIHRADIPQFVGLLFNKGMAQNLFKDEYQTLAKLSKKELKNEGLYQTMNDTFSIDGEIYEYDFDRYKARVGDLIEYGEGDMSGGIWRGDIFEVVEGENGTPVIFDRDGVEMDINDYSYTILKKQ
jgi:hypothetical protein